MVPDGIAHNVQVVRSIGLGLDETATGAVSAWKFKPGEKGGTPVPVVAMIEVNFRLSSVPYWHLTSITFSPPTGGSRPVAIKAAYQADSSADENANVSLSFDIDENGIPINFHVPSASEPKWEAAVISMVSGWQFKPGIKDGKAVSVPCTINLRRGEASSAEANFSPPQAGVQRIRVGGNVQSASLVTKIAPVYPALAKTARIEGSVHFNVLISREGNIESVQLISGHPLLIPAATEAVKQWTYRPTLLNGRPAEVITQVDVNFSLAEVKP